MTKSNLQRIIKEELASVLTEVDIAIDEVDRVNPNRAPERLELAINELIRHAKAYKNHLSSYAQDNRRAHGKETLNYSLISEIVDGAMNQFIKAVNLAANSYDVNYDYIEYEVGSNRLKVNRQAANSLAGEKNAIDKVKDNLRRVYMAPDDEDALNDTPDEDAPR